MAMAMSSDVDKMLCLDCQKDDKDTIRLKCKKHVICENCWDNREANPELRGKHRECQICHPDILSTEVLQVQPPKVWIYVDDSNLWISGKKAYAEVHKLSTSEDPRARFDIGQLNEVVAEKREVGGRILYGSEPPEVDTVWTKVKQHGWEVDIKQKSYHTGKEKQVDVQLVADVVSLVNQKKGGTVIIVSGDSDYIPAINEALDRGWQVEVWSWEKALSANIREHDRRGQGLRVEHLNRHIHQIMSVNSSFDPSRFTEEELLSRLKEASILLTISEKHLQGGKPKWTEFTGTLQVILKWPISYLRVAKANGYVEVLAIFLTVYYEKPDLDMCIKEIGKTKNMKRLNLTTKPLQFLHLHDRLGGKIEWMKSLLSNCKGPDVEFGDNASDTRSVGSTFTRSRRSSGVQRALYREPLKDSENRTVRKTKLCRHHDKSSCRKGDKCMYAHGERDPMAWCIKCEEKGHVAGEMCHNK